VISISNHHHHNLSPPLVWPSASKTSLEEFCYHFRRFLYDYRLFLSQTSRTPPCCADVEGVRESQQVRRRNDNTSRGSYLATLKCLRNNVVSRRNHRQNRSQMLRRHRTPAIGCDPRAPGILIDTQWQLACIRWGDTSWWAVRRRDVEPWIPAATRI
jgi:hypothetical protein